MNMLKLPPLKGGKKQNANFANQLTSLQLKTSLSTRVPISDILVNGLSTFLLDLFSPLLYSCSCLKISTNQPGKNIPVDLQDTSYRLSKSWMWRHIITIHCLHIFKVMNSEICWAICWLNLSLAFLHIRTDCLNVYLKLKSSVHCLFIYCSNKKRVHHHFLAAANKHTGLQHVMYPITHWFSWLISCP